MEWRANAATAAPNPHPTSRSGPPELVRGCSHSWTSRLNFEKLAIVPRTRRAVSRRPPVSGPSRDAKKACTRASGSPAAGPSTIEMAVSASLLLTVDSSAVERKSGTPAITRYRAEHTRHASTPGCELSSCRHAGHRQIIGTDRSRSNKDHYAEVLRRCRFPRYRKEQATSGG